MSQGVTLLEFVERDVHGLLWADHCAQWQGCAEGDFAPSFSTAL